MLDFDICDKARLARDPNYDGVFFTGVKSTGIYCRPVCAVKKPMTKNVEFFATAAGAEAAGYRPCLRCRPETAPFSPAWNGTKTTVHRALKLIDEGALDRVTVVEFAERLGVGPRHLARLFDRHVGATPTQVARTARIQRAKRLVDGSDLTMAEIANQSGFSSVRRFNAVFLELYGCSPSSLRVSRHG
jgi:AraC family transcriptional regulator of adaptative response / DNA-3-methyladenine glycosylase II